MLSNASVPSHYSVYLFQIIVRLFLNLQQNIPGSKDSNNFRFLMAKNIQRPQLRFKDKIDNSNTPFVPVIKRKPNALRPLEMGKYEKNRCEDIV